MPEKAANTVSNHSWNFRLNPMVHWSFKVLTLSVFLVILIVWGIDGWSFKKDFVTFKLNNQTQTQGNLVPFIASIHPNLNFHENQTQTQENLVPFIASIHSNLNFQENQTQTHQNLTQTQKNFPTIVTIPANLTQNQFNSTQNQPNITNFSPQNSLNQTDPSLDWISVELEPNYTSNLLAKWLAPGGEPCRESRTVEISIPNLDGNAQIELPTGHTHEIVFQALDENGKPNCLGGDYFETDLSGERWKSRPPVKDFGNGTYSLSLQIHPDFAGDYNLTIILLFRHYEGLKFSTQRFAFDRELRKFAVKFSKSSAVLQGLETCTKLDFARSLWSGRWTRHGKNDSCSIDREGRFKCLSFDFLCPMPWCGGYLGSLESNGWTYSAHCSFELFSSGHAWNCLSGRWIFFWGDSNHCDTIRNILHFILQVREIEVVPRRFDMNITNPKNHSQVVRITSIFNGHENETKNYQGLNSLKDEGYRDLLRGYFSGERVPDTVVMNSGLHDGIFWKNLRRFSEGAERASKFWAEVLGAVRERGVATPEVIYRSTVATGGYARSMAFNPQKMEAFNGVLLEKLRRRAVAGWVVDHFDMTFPWHYDNRCNDGVHYGRAPAKARWRDGGIGHQYFVDLMLGHVLLNALCAR
ncbi:Gelation factor like [Actinidia chinensis var. chinensis]|uniref:Gelation factor like n=1 Tax=Actinidia chinensis var. chinensis TaxID=1590841 RepID=A0A2R6RV62_ACTCC|nr:Gelation factor like [Actinidia chinensis var. chinensis]